MFIITRMSQSFVHNNKTSMVNIRSLCFLLLSLFIFACSEPNNTQNKSEQEKLSHPEPQKNGHIAIDAPEVSGATINQHAMLTSTSHVSDGTGDMFNGKRRFLGPLGAHAITYNGYQYVVYYEGKDRSLDKNEQYADVVIARRKQGSNNWERSVLQGYKVKSEDAHNRSTIGVSAEDGTIHISFDHHNQEQLNYARTKPGVANDPNKVKWEDSVFTFLPNLGLEDDIGIVTYPSLKAVPGGTVILYYRDGLSYGGDMRLAYYNSKSSKWEWVRELSSRHGSYLGVADERGPYLSGGIKVSDNNELMMSWLWRETSLGCANRRERVDEKMCNQGIYFAKSSDFGQTWQTSLGQTIADLTVKQPISIDTIGGPLIDVPHKARPSNVLNNSAIDPKTGYFHLFISHLKAPYDDIEKREVYHYQIKSDGSYEGKAVDFSARSATLAFLNDRLYAFAGRNVAEIYVASREDDFSQFVKVEMSQSDTLSKSNILADIEGGYITWDISDIKNGNASIIWHEKSGDREAGAASPLHVIDVHF